ncbi:uncharacterized protein [Antedon mediterranea]|uniref:uncharacterized protein n=1 Tax=Antedon mediterranea TaxID=105859 RepID=UPI003AF7F15E
MRTESDEHDGKSLDKKNKKNKNSALKKSTSQTEFDKEGDKTPNKKDEKLQKKSNLISHAGQQTESEKGGCKTPNEKEKEKPKKNLLSFSKKKGKKEKESNKIKDEQKNLRIKKEEPTDHDKEQQEKVIQNTMEQKKQPQEKLSQIMIPFNEQIAQMATSIGKSHNLDSSTSSTPVLQKNPEANQHNPTNQRLSFSDEISNLATKLGYKDKNEKTPLVISATATSPSSMPLIPTTSAATQSFTESPLLVSATSSITPNCVTKPVKKPPPPVMKKTANRRYSESFITHQITSKPTSTMNSSEPITSAPPVSALIFNFDSSVVDTKQTKQETIKVQYKQSTPSSQNMPVTTTPTARSIKLPSQQISQVQPNSRTISTDMPTRREPNYTQNPEESTPFRPRPLSEILTKLNYAGVSDPQTNFRKPSNTRFSNVDIDSSKKPNQYPEATPSISASSNTDMLTGVVKDKPPHDTETNGTNPSYEIPHTSEQSTGRKVSVSSLIGKFDDTTSATCRHDILKFNKPQFQKINPEPIYEEIDDIRKPLPTNNNYVNAGQNEPIYEDADETIYENWDIEGGTTADYETPAKPPTLNTNMYEGDYVNIPEHNVN